MPPLPLGSVNHAAPVRRLPRPVQLDFDLLETASDLARDGRAVDAIGKVLAHLFPDAEVGDLTAAPFSFVQGSSQVTARIDGDDLVVTVPLARLSAAGNPVAALRYVLTRVSGSGQLHQPRLRGDDLFLEFRDRLTRMHPSKVLEVLRRMPEEADRVDDWLVGEFGALPLDRADIEPLTDDEAARAHAAWRSHWDEIEELVKESQRKRSTWFLNEVTALASFRVQFMLPVCGHLGARLAESASIWNDANQDHGKREAALARCAREMKALSADELRANLGHARYALSPVAEGLPSLLSDYFASGNYIETIDRLRKSGKPLDAGLALVSTYNYLLARFAWPPAVATALMEGLEQAAGKSWRDAAALLFAHCKALVERFCSDDEGEDEDDEADDEADDGDDNDDGEQEK